VRNEMELLSLLGILLFMSGIVRASESCQPGKVTCCVSEIETEHSIRRLTLHHSLRYIVG
jgi:hypothetical protein